MAVHFFDNSPLMSPCPLAPQGNAAVRTQLCLAVTALAAHLPAVQWGQQGVVGWLAQRLGGEPQTVSLPCMLELLTVLPQVRAGMEGGEAVAGLLLAERASVCMQPVLWWRCLGSSVGRCKVRQRFTLLNTRLAPPAPHCRRRRRAATSRQCGRSGGGRCRMRCWHTRRRHVVWWIV